MNHHPIDPDKDPAMTWIDQVVADFGVQIGLAEVQLDSQRRLRLDGDDGYGIAFLDSSALPVPEFIVVVIQSSHYLKTFHLEQVLKRCHHTTPAPWPLQLGCSVSETRLAVRIPHRGLSLSSLNQAISFLRNLHTELR
jgi:hypothetical protein